MTFIGEVFMNKKASIVRIIIYMAILIILMSIVYGIVKLLRL